MSKRIVLIIVFALFFLACKQTGVKDSTTQLTMDIIEFDASTKMYYPASVKNGVNADSIYVKHTDLNIELGQSRFGGCIIDIPQNFKLPNWFNLFIQLDLTKISPHDNYDLLPENGQLYFFININTKKCKVVYEELDNKNLIRHTLPKRDEFYYGILMENFRLETESWNERYNEQKDWDYFAGSKRSKIFGIFTNCQFYEHEIKTMMNSNDIVLLQLGENGFIDDGVLSVVIKYNDLVKRKFNRCKFYWGHS